jgi:transposase-like protein
LAEEADPKMEERWRVVQEHLRGRLNGTEAAEALGVSRKTFYEWLDRAMEAMREALADRPPGRPPNPEDPEKVRLQEALTASERDRAMLESRLRIRAAFQDTLDSLLNESGPKKKAGKDRGCDRGG